MQELISAIGYLIVCSITPGPGNILTLNTTTTYGWKRGKYLVFGICTGTAVVFTFCTAAMYILSETFSAALTYVRYLGFAYLIWLAIHIMRSKPMTGGDTREPKFIQGFLPQIANMKMYMFFSSFLSGFLFPMFDSAAPILLMVVVAIGIAAVSTLTWAFLGTRIQTIYSKYYRPINIVLGLFLVYSAVLILRA